MSYDQTRFEPVPEEGDYETYALLNSQFKMASQNFVVKRLKSKKTNLYVTLICTHFPSKEAGFPERAMAGYEISKRIEEERKKDEQRKSKRNENFVIMGDLNGERHEMAYNFNRKIERLPEKAPSKYWAPFILAKDFIQGDKVCNNPVYEQYHKEVEAKKVVTPVDYEREILEKKKKIMRIEKICTDYCVDFFSQNKECKENCEQKAKKEKNVYDSLIPTHIYDKSTSKLIEANNFITEKKIRVKEIEFLNEPLYMKLLSIIKRDLKFVHIPEPPKFSGDGSDFWSVVVGFTDFIRARGKKEFFDLIAFLKTYDNGIPNIPTINFATTMLKINVENCNNLFKPLELNNWNIIDVVNNSLLFEEKIDFILIDTVKGAEVKKIEKLKDFDEQRLKGFPNNKHPSDHVPSKVSVEFTSGKLVQANRVLDKI